MSEIKVSICCLAYNHEKYIRQCLDGFMMQKGVTFEVLIHDDASTDHTADIIREYEAKYPDIIKPIYQTENQYSLGVPIFEKYLLPHVRGKYIALCEGDDYWCDDLKLYGQYKALEEHQECSVCVHNTEVIDTEGHRIRKRYSRKNMPKGVICKRDFIDIEMHGHGFHTSSYFCRREDFFSLIMNPPEYVKAYAMEDFVMILYFASIGSVYNMGKTMSKYRVGVKGSLTNRANLMSENEVIAKKEKLVQSINLFDKCTEHKYKSSCEFRIHLCEFEMKIQKKPKEILFPKNWFYCRCYGKKFIVLCFLKALFPRVTRKITMWHYRKREK